jgi:hypothetical protein
MLRSHKFNWAELDRCTLFDMLYSAKDKVVNVPFAVYNFHDLIVRHIKAQLPVKASRVYDKKVDPGWAWVGGAYYSDLDADHLQCIEINFSYHDIKDNIKITNHRFKRMCTLFADTVLHEIIHMRQFRKRNFKHLPDYASTARREKKRLEQEYLGNNDEIDAYAFNIACEVLSKADYDHRQAIRLLNEDQKGKRRVGTCWRVYLNAFNHDHNHPIIKRMKKRVAYYLPKAERGRPFRSCDWITR